MSIASTSLPVATARNKEEETAAAKAAHRSPSDRAGEEAIKKDLQEEQDAGRKSRKKLALVLLVGLSTCAGLSLFTALMWLGMQHFRRRSPSATAEEAADEGLHEREPQTVAHQQEGTPDATEYPDQGSGRPSLRF